MAMLVRWQFNSCIFDPQSAFDRWWMDMQIELQEECEKTISQGGIGKSLIYWWHGEKRLYKIDLIRMTQENLNSGTVRLIRRTTLLNFYPEKSKFVKGRLKRDWPVVPEREEQGRSYRRKEKE